MMKFKLIQKTILTFVFTCIFLLQNVNAQQIVIDGNTATQLQISGSVTDVSTSTIQGNVAFNSFDKFDVNQGNTVNLRVPTGTNNLLNLVHNQKTTINGVLNAFKDGQIGGNIYFLNPHGIIVGVSGVVNVGSLTAITPTKEFMKGFFSSPASPSLTATSQVLNGSVPINPSALISIKGKINAINDVQILGGDVIHEGGIKSFVNVNGAQAGNQLIVKNGVIKVVASDDVTITGKISVDGADNFNAGDIDIRAGGDVTLDKNAVVSAKGQGSNSNGGNIIILADHNAKIDRQAVLDTRGGDVSGNGGFIEFSAKDTVNVNGGQMLANAVNGIQGKILLDPAILNLNSDDYTNGAEKIFEASERINVNGVTISSRQIAGNNHLNGDSIGDSGSLFFYAPEIIVNPGSSILAQANNGFMGGFVELIASFDGEVISANPINRRVQVMDSTLKGLSVDLLAGIDVTSSQLVNNTSKINANAEVKVGSGTLIVSDQTQNTGAFIWAVTNLMETQIGKLTNIESNVSANSQVEDGANLYGGGGVIVRSQTRNDITAFLDNTESPVYENISTLFSKATSKSYASVNQGASIDLPKGYSLDVSSVAETHIDISLLHQKNSPLTNSGVFAVSEVDSIAESYVRADLNIPNIIFDMYSTIQSNVKATTSFPVGMLSLEGLQESNLPVSITAAVSKHKNAAKAGFLDDAKVNVDNVGIAIAAIDQSQLFVDPGENGENGIVIGIRHGDFSNEATYFLDQDADVTAREGLFIDVQSSAPDSINEISILSRKFLNETLGSQNFYSRLLNLQKNKSKSSNQFFTLVKIFDSSSESTSMQTPNSSSSSSSSHSLSSSLISLQTSNSSSSSNSSQTSSSSSSSN